MASSFFNLGSIIGGLGCSGYWLDPHYGPRAILGLALGTLIGGALQLAVQLPALRRAAIATMPDFSWRDPGVRRDLAADGAVGDRGQQHPGQRAGELGVRLRSSATARPTG